LPYLTICRKALQERISYSSYNTFPKERTRKTWKNFLGCSSNASTLFYKCGSKSNIEYRVRQQIECGSKSKAAAIFTYTPWDAAAI